MLADRSSGVRGLVVAVVVVTTLWTVASVALLRAAAASERLVTDTGGRLVPATTWDAAAEAIASAGTVVQPAVLVLAAVAVRRASRVGPWLLVAAVALLPPLVLVVAAVPGSGERAGLTAAAGPGVGRWALLMLAVAVCGALAGLAARHHLPSVVAAALVVPTAVAVRAVVRDVSAAPAASAGLPAVARESVLLGGTRISSAGGEAYVGALEGGVRVVVLMLVAAAVAASAAGFLRVLRQDDAEQQV
ncbi:hypothetical protein GCM10009737_33480 [Nocardioides lentus]|uniref:Uncharacterized protein n=1 Tax=Nocardioides lentus TaxID=338077 RepID=A0ABN2PQD6_9ACTN